MNLKNILLVKKPYEYEREPQSYVKDLDNIWQYLRSKGIIPISIISDSISEHIANVDLVITYGGDGTVLHAADQITDKTPLLALRHDASLGALCTASTKTFKETIDAVLNNKYRIEEWQRLECVLGDKSVLALNEVQIASNYYKSMKYTLTVNGNTDSRTASKFIVATGTGSTGVYSLITHHLNRFLPEVQMIAYGFSETSTRPKLCCGLVHGREPIAFSVESQGIMAMPDNIIKNYFYLPPKEKLTIRLSDCPVMMVRVDSN